MTQLYAQPYDISATGFYFEAVDEFTAKAANLRNAYGQPVEEFEIQCIDGDCIDCELFDALSVNQCNLDGFFDATDNWSDDDKIKAIIAVGECGHSFALGSDHPDKFDISLYRIGSLRELAIDFVDEGLFGDIAPSIACYIDYDAIARDLACDYGEVVVDGINYAYRDS